MLFRWDICPVHVVSDSWGHSKSLLDRLSPAPISMAKVTTPIKLGTWLVLRDGLIVLVIAQLSSPVIPGEGSGELDGMDGLTWRACYMSRTMGSQARGVWLYGWVHGHLAGRPCKPRFSLPAVLVLVTCLHPGDGRLRSNPRRA